MKLIGLLRKVSASHFAKSTSIVFVLRLLNVALAFAFSVFLARSLGLSKFGAYATYMAVMSLIVLPMTSGVPNLLIREAAPAFEDGNLAKVRGVIFCIFWLLGVYLGCLAVAGFMVYLVTPSWLSIELLVLLWPHALFQVLAAIRSAVLRAAGRIVRGQLLERAVQPFLALVFSGGALLVLGDDFDVYHVVSALLVAHAVAMIVGGVWVRRFAFGPGERSPVEKSRLWREGLHLSGSGLLSSVMINGIVLMISTLSSLESTGLYRIAASVAQPLVFAHEVLVQVVAPRLAQYWDKGNRLALEKLLYTGVIVSFGTVVVGTVLLFFIGHPLLEWAYGAGSGAAFSTMMVLALAHCANASGGFDQELLNMSGHSDIVFRGTAFITVISLILAMPVTYYFGSIGVSCILASYQLFSAILFVWYTKKTTGFNPSILGFSGVCMKSNCIGDKHEA